MNRSKVRYNEPFVLIPFGKVLNSLVFRGFYRD